MTLDPVHTYQMRLDGIAAEMHATLFRTAVSPVVREGADAASALFCPEGRLLALSPAIPLLLGALPEVGRAILAACPPDEMREGDLFWMNDPYAGGTHLPDIAVLRPVFLHGRLIGHAASLLHHQDVGGMRAGSVPPDATEIFQEGLRLPPGRLGAGDRIAPAAEGLIAANSRVPEVVLGDLGAQIGAARRAGVALARLAAESGAEGFAQRVEAALDAGERSARAAIAEIPEGRFVATDRLDPTDGLPDAVVNVALFREGETLCADFTGSARQVPAPINCVRSGPLSAMLYVLLMLVGPGACRNGGMLRTLRLTLPEASVVNAAPPAPLNARTGMVRCITSALLQAMAEAMPDRMPAANSGMSYVLAFSGTGADGARFVSTEIVAGGAGGGPEAPGAPGISTDVGNAMNMPAEALEAALPMRLLRAEVRRGSGGAGRHPGGDGILREYLALADGIAVSLRGERFVTVPRGAAGGGSPAPARATVLRADGREERLAARSSLTLDTGDRLVVESCGGAGWGTP